MSLIGQKYITTAVTKKVHGPGADFVDLLSALQWAGQYIITPSGSLTFLIAPGRWTYTNTVEINHPNSNRITIQGGALLGGSPTPDNLSVTGYHNPTDGSAQIIYLRSVYATELSFTGGITGFHIMHDGVIFRYLLITGSQSGGDELLGAQGIEALAQFFVDGIAIWGFGGSGIHLVNANCIQLTSLSVTCCFCGWYGIEIIGGSYIAQSNSYVILHSSGAGGIFVDGGYAWFQTVSCQGSGIQVGATWGGGIGALMYAGGFITCTGGSSFDFNAIAGAYVAGSCTFLAESCYFLSNGQFGFVMQGSGTAWLIASAFAGNGADDISNSGGYVLGP